MQKDSNANYHTSLASLQYKEVSADELKKISFPRSKRISQRERRRTTSSTSSSSGEGISASASLLSSHSSGSSRKHNSRMVVEAIRLDPTRLAVGTACVIIAAIPLMITPNLSPRGMAILCDDTTVKQPFHRSTVPSWLLFFVGYLSAFCIFLGMGLVAQYRFSYIQPGQRPRVYYIFQRIVPRAVVDLLRGYATYMFGTFLTMSMTDIIKVLVGRPRPNFWNVCNPTFVINGTRVDECQPGTFIESYECRNEVAREIRESRLSFLSGHTSFAFYCATYLACYLERKFRPVQLPCLRLLLQVLLIFSALLTGLSRIVDNKHHWSDVLCGAILGMIVGYYTEKLNDADLFGRGVVVEQNPDDDDDVEDGGLVGGEGVTNDVKSSGRRDFDRAGDVARDRQGGLEMVGRKGDEVAGLAQSSNPRSEPYMGVVRHYDNVPGQSPAYNTADRPIGYSYAGGVGPTQQVYNVNEVPKIRG